MIWIVTYQLDNQKYTESFSPYSRITSPATTIMNIQRQQYFIPDSKLYRKFNEELRTTNITTNVEVENSGG